uniref:Uncharacterized protein n=1 Tax=Stegastes partitus TaxID=144197 RepID=A0A3B5A7C1_9TELE
MDVLTAFGQSTFSFKVLLFLAFVSLLDSVSERERQESGGEEWGEDMWERVMTLHMGRQLNQVSSSMNEGENEGASA